MHPRYPNMFSPLRLGPVEVPNRFYFSPHGLPLTIGNEPSSDFVAYNLERVKGGTGLIVSSVTAHPRAASFQPSPYSDHTIPSFRVASDAIHEAGGKFFFDLGDERHGNFERKFKDPDGVIFDVSKNGWQGTDGYKLKK